MPDTTTYEGMEMRRNILRQAKIEHLKKKYKKYAKHNDWLELMNMGVEVPYIESDYSPKDLGIAPKNLE